MTLTYTALQTVINQINADLEPKRKVLQLMEDKCALARKSLNPFKRRKVDKLTAQIVELRAEIKERHAALLNSLSQEFDNQVDGFLHQHVSEIFSMVSSAPKYYQGANAASGEWKEFLVSSAPKSDQDAKGTVLLLSDMIEKGIITDTLQFRRQLQVENTWCHDFFNAFPGLAIDQGWELTLLSMTWSRCRLFLRNSSGTVCDNIWKHIYLKGDIKSAVVDAILLDYIIAHGDLEQELPPAPISDMKSLYKAFSYANWEPTEELRNTSFDFRIEKNSCGDYQYHFLVFWYGSSLYRIMEYGGKVKALDGRPFFLLSSEREVASQDNGFRWSLRGAHYPRREGFW
ncbi:MAG: hypothetical protein IK066_11290 [Kiritimatiellae bacterium]|nr:hypothetical protein [Kiritimatiellia bacterium]